MRKFGLFIIWILCVSVSNTRSGTGNNIFSRRDADTVGRDNYYTPLNRGELVNVNGIPFIEGKFLVPEKEGATVQLNTNHVIAESFYILGCVNSISAPGPDWGGSNDFRSYFIGDSVGTISIHYVSGVKSNIPLILGYNVWWGDVYRNAPEPFVTNKTAKKLLEKSLFVANGVDTVKRPYFIKIALGNSAIQEIVLNDNPAKAGYFMVNGITFNQVKNELALDRQIWQELKGTAISADDATWMKNHTIRSDDSYSPSQQKAVLNLLTILTTFPSDISAEKIAQVKPQITRENFRGPKIRFSGSATADLLTNIYYENSQQILNRVDDSTGKVHESSKNADYYRGFGTYTPRLSAFYTDSYTRIRALTLITAMGFTQKTNLAIKYFDDWMMYFPKAYPAVQLDGKPIPAHAVVVADKPHFYFDVLDRTRWPTKYKTRDFGNPENDGHGLLMLTAWRTWLKTGRSDEWVRNRWDVIEATADYIPWALQNPGLSFSEHGLLHSESEGGMNKISMYCDLECYLGLLAYAEMAEQIGKIEKAKEWQNVAAEYLNSMNAYYPVVAKPWGEVWDSDKSAEWPSFNATLAPAVMGMDYWGFDVMNRMPKTWQQITRNTYRRQMKEMSPPSVASDGMGYGQSYLTEASLLMDDMKGAAKNVYWLSGFCFSPRQESPYRVPEGITMKRDGSKWRRWGDLGNLYQLAEVVYTIHVMLGIDDLNEDTLLLMPRLTDGINELDIAEWPVRTRSGSQSSLIPISVHLKRNVSKQTIKVEVSSSEAISHFRFRLGPFPPKAKKLSLTINGKKETKELQVSGDSKWAWINFDNGAEKTYFVDATAY